MRRSKQNLEIDPISIDDPILWHFFLLQVTKFNSVINPTHYASNAPILEHQYFVCSSTRERSYPDDF